LAYRCFAAAILLRKTTHKIPIKEAFADAKAMVIIMKRSLSLILAGILLASLAGCGGDSTDVQTDTGTENTTVPVETEPAYAPKLPDTDMSGETYTIFTTGWYSYQKGASLTRETPFCLQSEWESCCSPSWIRSAPQKF
jgi:hypothetical protein